MLKKSFCVLLLCSWLGACATNPMTGRHQFIIMPDAQIDQMGLQAFKQMKNKNPISRNVGYNQFVRCIADTLIRQTGGHWEVVVFEDPSLNAFALPGNKIGIHTGMVRLVDNQDQLATVIAHEIGHVLSRHSNERISQQMAVRQGLGLLQITALGQDPTVLGLLGLGAEFGILMPYSRTKETEADIIGLELMAKAGFDPRQSVVLWQKMEQASQGREPVEFLSTHPSHSTRIQDLQQRLPQAMNLFQQAQAAGMRPQCHKNEP